MAKNDLALARLLAILSELNIDELRLVELFVEWLAAGMPAKT